MSAAPQAAALAGRISARFADLRAEGRGGLVTFVTAGDPDLETAWEILQGLPAAGADIIELGMPFSDPMADGPAIQAASLRALQAGQTLRKTLDMVRRFREGDSATPLVLMGYYNPIYQYGVDAFVADAAAAGVDGLIVVDLPPEESDELLPQARAAGIDFIRLATPTSDDNRLPVILSGSGGFVYYVSVLGITGTKSAAETATEEAVARLRRHTDLPVVVGFGIRTPEAAAVTARIADAAVVGSAIVDRIKAGLDEDGKASSGLSAGVLAFVRDLAGGVRGARG